MNINGPQGDSNRSANRKLANSVSELIEFEVDGPILCNECNQTSGDETRSWDRKGDVGFDEVFG